MNLNSHSANLLVNTVAVNDRDLAGTGLRQVIDGRSEVDTVHVRFVKSTAVKRATMRGSARAAAQPGFSTGYALPQRPHAGVAVEPAASPRWAPLWAALAMCRQSQV